MDGRRRQQIDEVKIENAVPNKLLLSSIAVVRTYIHRITYFLAYGCRCHYTVVTNAVVRAQKLPLFLSARRLELEGRFSLCR
jgi:hypothetical protein